MLTFTALCLVAVVAGINSACIDRLPTCFLLDEVYCQGPFVKYAAQVCAETCGLCDENSSLKRAHNHEPAWIEHCWDHGNPEMDPFCALLTTTVPTTTTPTTTQPTTTTTEPTTTTTATPMRICEFEEFNETSIDATNFAEIVNEANITINESVHLIGSLDYCSSVCLQSILNGGLECWGYSFNDEDKCYLYYYDRPIAIEPEKLLTADNSNDTTLFLKRCSNVTTDPITTPRPTVPTTAPAATSPTVQPPVVSTASTSEPVATTKAPETTTTTAPVVQTTAVPVTTTTEAMETFGGVDTTSTTAGPVVTQAPAATTQEPAVTTPPASTAAPPTIIPGVPGIKYNTTTKTGPPSPVDDMCFYANTTYALGDTWKPSCRWTCTCIDVTTNTANCVDSCPNSQVLPSGCILQPVSGQCCDVEIVCNNGTTQVKPTDTVGPQIVNPGGPIQSINTTTFTKVGAVSPVADMCFYDNQTYQLNESWKMTCRWTCTCIDVTTNTAMCSDKCPNSLPVPSGCVLQAVTGQCCDSEIVCDNSTITDNSTVADCDDTEDNCNYYDDNACQEPFVPWAKAHCAKRCGFCGAVPCVDKLVYCDLFELDTACVDYRGWARDNCRKSCHMCT